MAPSAGCWLSLPHLVSNWSGLQTDWISWALSYIIVLRPPSSCGQDKLHSSPHPQSRLHSAIPRPDTPVIYIGAFPILTARPGRRSIYNSITNNLIKHQSFIAFIGNAFEMRLLNLRINFYLLRTFCSHLGSLGGGLLLLTTFRPNFTSGLLQVINCDLG